MKMIKTFFEKMSAQIDRKIKDLLNKTSKSFNQFNKDLNKAIKDVTIKETKKEEVSEKVSEFSYPSTNPIKKCLDDVIVLLEDVIKMSYSSISFLSSYLFKGAKKTIRGKKLSQIMKYKNFGMNIYEYLDDVIKDLSIKQKAIVMQQLASGFTKQAIIQNASKRLSSAFNRVKSIILTESTRCETQAKLLALKEDKYLNQVQVIATLDLKTSQVCRKKDGKIYDLNKVSLSDLPPYHVRCRSTFCPYVEDIEERLDNENRDIIKFQTYYDWYKTI